MAAKLRRMTEEKEGSHGRAENHSGNCPGRRPCACGTGVPGPSPRGNESRSHRAASSRGPPCDPAAPRPGCSAASQLRVPLPEQAFWFPRAIRAFLRTPFSPQAVSARVRSSVRSSIPPTLPWEALPLAPSAPVPRRPARTPRKARPGRSARSSRETRSAGPARPARLTRRRERPSMDRQGEVCATQNGRRSGGTPRTVGRRLCSPAGRVEFLLNSFRGTGV